MTRLAAVLLLATVAAPRVAHAWAYEGVAWGVHQMPVEYTIGPACRDFDDAETVDLVNRVFQRWEDVDCSHISFEYLGRGMDFGLGSGGFGFLGDGFNNVSWCSGCLGGSALGVAVLDGNRSGLFDECDEYMEDNYEWTTDHDLAAVEWGYIDAEAVTAQESGHCLGLGHTDVDRATMYPTYIPYWEMWTPDPDDIEGLCWIYPMEDGCVTNDDCRDPEENSCVDGVCLPLPPPPREYGYPCIDASECLSGVCVLDPGSGENACSEPCDLGAPACPEDGVCARFGPCAEAFCVSSTPGDGAPASACAIDDDCASGLCDGDLCAVPCDPMAPACPDDTGCWETDDACGACRPGPPPAAVGTPCESDADCPGRVCAHVGEDWFCSDLCDTDEDCPQEAICADVEGVGVCVPPGGFLGDDCENNDDCGSALCAHLGDDAYCTRYCDEIACPAGWECVDAGGYLICARKAADEGGCGCATTTSPPLTLLALLFLLGSLSRGRTR